MAKPLREPQPSSSVARMFDVTAAARALALPEQSPTTADQQPERTQTFAIDSSRRPTRKRLFMLTRAGSDTFDRIVALYRNATDTCLTDSHVMRAVLLALRHAFDSIEREADAIGTMKLPSNAPEYALDRERFERRLAVALLAGVRATSMMPME